MRKQILTAAVMAAIAGMSIAAQADESTTVGGKAYLDFTNKTVKSSGTTTDKSTGFDLKRFYLSVGHSFDDMWSANLTTDVIYASDCSPTGSTTVVTNVGTTPASDVTISCSGPAAVQTMVKKAYLQAKFSDAAVLRVGSADMPWIPYVEHAYGYRWVEATLTDRNHFANSADWGAHLGGKVGMVNYAVSAVNGNGYKHPDRSKSLDFAGRVGVMPIAGLNLAAGFYDGKLGNNTYANANNPSLTINTAKRMDVLAAYSHDMFKVGAEFFSAKDWNNLSSSSTKASGYSAFGSVNAGKGIAVFARYDQDKPAKNSTDNPKQTYYHVGVSYEARKNVDLALAYKNTKVTHNTTGVGDDKATEVGIWTQVKF
ncbi:MAG: porin [Gammaproteobacteria bacterium]|jgi:hypothetical protein